MTIRITSSIMLISIVFAHGALGADFSQAKLATTNSHLSVAQSNFNASSATSKPSAAAAPAQNDDWLSAAQQHLLEREYHVSKNDQGLQAPNRAQAFRSYFDNHGIRVVSRDQLSHTLLRMALVGIGRDSVDKSESQSGLIGDTRLEYLGNQVDLVGGNCQTRFSNKADGLAAEWIIAQAPVGTGLMNVLLNVEHARAEIADNGVLLHNQGDTLHLSSMLATDAQNNPLPMSLKLQANQLVLQIDDAGAAFPISIRSLLKNTKTQAANTSKSVHDGVADALLESNQTEAQFGISVAGAGDVNGDGYGDLIVGAPAFDNGENGEGAAFLFFGSAGTLSIVADAQLESNQVNAKMGISVAGAGDVNGDGYADVIVGAENFDSRGAAFIYFGGAGAFSTTANAQLLSDVFGARFGASVASAGDVNGDGYADVIVGAPTYTDAEFKEGAALIYFGGAGAFDTVADANLQLNQPSAAMGGSVASAGDVNGDGYADVIIGARAYSNGESDEGAAFLYLGGAGVFNSTLDAQLESNQIAALFGTSVAGAGDVNGDGFADVIVGAPFYDTTEIDAGSAFVYFGAAGAFNTTPDEQLPSFQANANMGWSVAGVGDVNGDGYADVVSGAPRYFSGEIEEGGAFLHLGSASGFDNFTDGRFHSNQAGAILGLSVAGAGDINGDGYADVIVGAHKFDNGQIDEGAAFVYFGGADDFLTLANALLESNQASAGFSDGVAGAGDVNGDGYADVIVGASEFDNGEVDEGVAFIYFGGEGSFDTVADALLEADQSNARFGVSVAGAGDVNGDGYADVIVGARFFSNGEAIEGAAFIFLGGAGAFNSVADAQLESNQAGAQLGRSVAGAGDVNGDGYADVLVGAPLFDNGQTDEGAAFIYFGGAGAFNSVADAQLESNQADALLGWSVAGVGDVNGDGFADVLVGVPLFDNGHNDEGAALLYFGSAGVFNTVAAAQLESNQAGALLGESVAGAGDVNGDGFADLILGVPLYSSGQANEGVAAIFFGGAGAFNTVVDAIMESNQASANLGVSVAGGGDINGDGYADVIVGAYFFDNGENNEGAAFIYYGGAGVFDNVADAQLESNQNSSLFGLRVANAGDVNGDGYADVIVGSRLYDNGLDNEGAAFVYYGTANGRVVLANQYRGDGSSVTVQPGNLSYTTDGFVVALNATSPRGRERAKLQIQACPNGAPFDSLLCEPITQSTWTEIPANANGVSLVEPIGGLTNNLLYHWRARVQYAPLTVTSVGITEPAKPLSGPWRRLQASATNADIRTGLPPPDLLFANGFE